MLNLSFEDRTDVWLRECKGRQIHRAGLLCKVDAIPIALDSNFHTKWFSLTMHLSFSVLCVFHNLKAKLIYIFFILKGRWSKSCPFPSNSHFQNQEKVKKHKKKVKRSLVYSSCTHFFSFLPTIAFSRNSDSATLFKMSNNALKLNVS